MGTKRKKSRGKASATEQQPTASASADGEPVAENSESAGTPEDNREQEQERGGGSWPVDRLQPVVEALLFAAADPVTPRKMAGCVPGATADEIRAAIRVIREEYDGRGVRLVEVAGGWQMRTAAEYHEYVRPLFKQKQFRLTRAGIETVAIVAYRQPATRAEIEEVRGVDCSGVLESLVERGVVRVAGRRDVPGRPLVYVTTPRFLETFGLKDLTGLPTLAELGDDLRGLADSTGFEEGDDRDAGILPLEDSEIGDEAYSQADNAESAPEDGEGSLPKLSFARGSAEGGGDEEATDDDNGEIVAAKQNDEDPQNDRQG